MMNRFLYKLVAVVFSILMTGSAAPVLAEAGPSAPDAQTAVKSSALPAQDKAAILALIERAAALGVPDDDLAVITGRAIARGADQASLSALLRTVITAIERQLPLRPVLDRIEQGLAKGASFQRIDASAARLRGYLEEGTEIIVALTHRNAGTRRDPGWALAVEAAARALEQSVPSDRLRGAGSAALAGSGGLSLAAASFASIGALASNGVSTDQADRIVRKALSAGYSEHALAGLERQILADLKAGKPVAAAADDMESSIERRSDRGGDGGRDHRGAGERGLGGGGGRR